MKSFVGRTVVAGLLVAAGWNVVRGGPTSPKSGPSLGPRFGPGLGPMRGFFAAAWAREAEFEKAFRAVPTPARAREDLLILTQAPHVAGTPEDYKTAQYVLGQFREAGLDAKLVEYQVLLPMPKEVKVDLVEPFKRAGPTPEGGWNSSDASIVAAFNAYSPSGDVTAPVVYANYGLPEDYERLNEMGIDVAGKMVIVRYGECFRGVKAFVAEEHHAAGLLIYSDPAEDGYRQGDVYPRGPWRPATAVQRGSIIYHTAYAGDPLTPGVAATKDAKRLGLKDAKTLPHIPTTPLSYGDASPILENLGGPVAPGDWQGALPFPYHVGPGASKVHLKLDMDFQIRPIWDVLAEIPGTLEPDQRVVLGNHRDAWTYGAVDPDSGTAPLLAVARGLGQLLNTGWKPERSLVLASWDAEEFGLIGSTEWVEEQAEQLTRGAVAYLNIDVGVAGTHFNASAVPSLARLIREVSQDVTDPNTGRPLYAIWSEESQKVRRESGMPIMTLTRGAAPSVPPEAMVGELGSGSDYTPFFQHLGVPSLDLGFGGPYGVYHARYDNFYWMQHFGDPTFKYSMAAAQVLGTLALRLADADLLPFEYEDYGRALLRHLRDLEADMRKAKQEDKLRFQEPLKAAENFTQTAASLSQRLAEVESETETKTETKTRGGGLDAKRLAAVNRDLLEVERDFLLEKGLPGRAWFRHAFYAPGVYTGYAAVVLPGVREAADRNDWTTAAEQLDLVRAALARGTATLNHALQTLAGK